MATITLTIPDAVAPRVLDAIAARYAFTGFEPDGVTPQTKATFARLQLLRWLKNEVLEHEQAQAAAAARDAVTPVPI